MFLQTGRAIKFAVDHVFSASQRASQVKNRIAVVVTDGKSQDDVVSVAIPVIIIWVDLNHSGSFRGPQKS